MTSPPSAVSAQRAGRSKRAGEPTDDQQTLRLTAGMAVVAVVFLCTALASALLVHNGPHHAVATPN